MSPVLQMPERAIHLDANGLPRGHDVALERTTQRLMELVNDLPGGQLHCWYDDARWMASAMLQVYLHELRKA